MGRHAVWGSWALGGPWRAPCAAARAARAGRRCTRYMGEGGGPAGGRQTHCCRRPPRAPPSWFWLPPRLFSPTRAFAREAPRPCARAPERLRRLARARPGGSRPRPCARLGAGAEPAAPRLRNGSPGDACAPRRHERVPGARRLIGLLFFRRSPPPASHRAIAVAALGNSLLSFAQLRAASRSSHRRLPPPAPALPALYRHPRPSGPSVALRWLSQSALASSAIATPPHPWTTPSPRSPLLHTPSASSPAQPSLWPSAARSSPPSSICRSTSAPWPPSTSWSTSAPRRTSPRAWTCRRSC